MATNLISNKRSKQIDIRHHMERDYDSMGVFELNYFSTEYDIAYVMTKALDKAKQ